MPLTAVSLFSGAGGMDVGFTRAGFKVLWAAEENEAACDTYNHNAEVAVAVQALGSRPRGEACALE